MKFGDLVGRKLPDLCLTGQEKPRKTSPWKFIPTGNRTRARCVTDAHATVCSTAEHYSYDHHNHNQCSAQRQVFHCKLRHQDYSSAQREGLPPQTQEPRLQFYKGWIGAVPSHCFPHSTFSLASEQTLKDLKISQGHQRGGEASGFGELGPPDFTEMHHRV